MNVTYWGEHSKRLWSKKVIKIGHYGIVRDYTLTFKDKTWLELSADVIKPIVECEAIENKDES